MEKSSTSREKQIGIWIDHTEAILVFLNGGQATVERIDSLAESHFRHSGGARSGGANVAQSVSKEQKADERREHQYHRFYRQVIKEAGDADTMFIFGPGEAKIELAKEIKKIKGRPKRTVAVETSDKLTENQIVAKVKSFF